MFVQKNFHKYVSGISCACEIMRLSVKNALLSSKILNSVSTYSKVIRKYRLNLCYYNLCVFHFRKDCAMPKIPDFSKFDLQSIVNSVKTIIGAESTPKVTEGDPIGTKIVEISKLLQSVASMQSQSSKDLTKINDLLNGLYRDLEAFRKLEQEIRQKEQAQATQTQSSATSDTTHNRGGQTTSTATGGHVHGGGTPSEQLRESVAGRRDVNTDADLKAKREAEKRLKEEMDKKTRENKTEL